MGFSIGGLASGIDTNSIVEQLVAASRKPLAAIESQQSALESRKSAYGTLKARLGTLQDAFDAVADAEDFRSVSGRSASPDEVGVTVTGSGVVGRFAVQVTSLASASMHVSSGISDRTTAGILATGTLDITVGTTTTQVTVDATMSLDDVVDAINENVSGATAYVMETGDTSAPYRLVVGGDDTGLANAVSISTANLTGGGTVPSFTAATSAADAVVEINGVTVYDDDNDIDGAIEGVTFHAYEETSSAIDVTVERDVDAMVEKVQTVVDAWNAVMSQIRAQKVWNPDDNMKGAFVGEAQPRAVVQSLQSLLSAEYGTGTFDHLSELGLSTSQDGDLSFDSTAFTDALDEDFDAVVSLVTSSSGVATTLSEGIEEMIGTEGTVTGRIDSLDDQIETMTERIDAYEDRLAAYRARLEKQFLAMEVAMARYQSMGSSLSALTPDTSKK